jgi:hypothetical protein
MDITKILNTNRVILDMKASKTEAIEELTDILQKDGAISCGKRLFRMSGSVNQKARPASKIILRSAREILGGGQYHAGNWAYRQDIPNPGWQQRAASFCLPYIGSKHYAYSCFRRLPARWRMTTLLNNC